MSDTTLSVIDFKMKIDPLWTTLKSYVCGGGLILAKIDPDTLKGPCSSSNQRRAIFRKPEVPITKTGSWKVSHRNARIEGPIIKLISFFISDGHEDKKNFLVAYEQPGPKEIAILENPFDLAAEGIKVSNAELQAASKMNFKNVKIDMDA